MIIDALNHRCCYAHLGSRFDQAFEAIEGGITDKADGRYELDGENVVALVQRYTTRLPEQGKWETHRKYIDLQYLSAGEERMGWQLREMLTVTEAYDAKRDVEFYGLPRAYDWITLRAGLFVVFYPQDAHLPTIQLHGPSQVCKVVFKIAV